MDTNKINLFVFDDKDNFENTKTQLGFEGSTLKRIINIKNVNELQSNIENQLNDEDHIFLVVHVFAKKNILGINEFLVSGITDKYPNLEYMYISEGASDKDIRKEMVEHDIDPKPIFRYHQVLSKLKADEFKVLTKKELLQQNSSENFTTKIETKKQETEEYPKCDYAIITALEETEMEKVLPMIDVIGKIKNKKHLIAYGCLKANREKTIVFASQLATGMVDASILSTELIIRFNPKFLIMAGVLGGKPNEVNIGDVVIATKVFTIDKGKITDLGFQIELESSSTDGAYITEIKREKKRIINYIEELDATREHRINIHFGSIACVRSVIDLEGFFEEKVTEVDRKAIALEMESYGISRTCEIVNDGNTIPLIIKSAMDNTKDKVDNAKPYAAWTSAKVVEYILENNLI